MSGQDWWDAVPADGSEMVGTLGEFLNYATIIDPDAWRQMIKLLPDSADDKIASGLWPCGCLINKANAHRVGCPDHPGGYTGYPDSEEES